MTLVRQWDDLIDDSRIGSSWVNSQWGLACAWGYHSSHFHLLMGDFLTFI